MIRIFNENQRKELLKQLVPWNVTASYEGSIVALSTYGSRKGDSMTLTKGSKWMMGGCKRHTIFLLISTFLLRSFLYVPRKKEWIDFSFLIYFIVPWNSDLLLLILLEALRRNPRASSAPVARCCPTIALRPLPHPPVAPPPS